MQASIFKQSQHIACYLSIKNEFDALPLIKAVWQANKHCYIPVLSEANEKILSFAKYDEGDALHLNHYSILEPINTSRLIAPEKLDIVIVPLIAFDAALHRLGTGGGYYDRTFAFTLNPATKRPQLIGLAYAQQQAENIPAEPWDILLDAVVTEKGFVK